MKKLGTFAVGFCLSVFLAAVVSAAPTGTPDKPKQQQGITNAKKAMQGKMARDKKVEEVRKQGQAKKKLARRGA